MYVCKLPGTSDEMTKNAIKVSNASWGERALLAIRFYFFLSLFYLMLSYDTQSTDACHSMYIHYPTIRLSR